MGHGCKGKVTRRKIAVHMTANSGSRAANSEHITANSEHRTANRQRETRRIRRDRTENSR